jgi:hypothetical protein
VNSKTSTKNQEHPDITKTTKEAMMYRYVEKQYNFKSENSENQSEFFFNHLIEKLYNFKK